MKKRVERRRRLSCSKEGRKDFGDGGPKICSRGSGGSG